MEKIKNICKKINIPISIFISISYGYYRKPCTGSFKIYLDTLKKHNKNPNLKKSFYCGDAAGRPKGWNKNKKKKDFSSSDLFFAKNIGIKFFLPEEVFGDLKNVKLPLPKRKFLNCKAQKIILPVKKSLINLILLVGKPASGKSYLTNEIVDLCKNLYFNIISQDKLKTKAKVKKEYTKMVKKGVNIIIDSTNSKKNDREYYIDLLLKNYKKKEVNIICIKLNTSNDMIRQLNYFRTEYSEGKEKFIPDVVYHVYNKYYQEPTKSEGINHLLNYEVCPQFKGNKKKIFNYYY